MTPGGPQPISLTYEAGVSRERLPDGSLRITVVTRRGGALALLAGFAGAIVLLSAVAWMVGANFLPKRWVLMGFVLLPLCLACLFAIWTSPRRHTHVVQVGPEGLHLDTLVSGDPVHRFHPRAEIVSVQRRGMFLEVRTTRDFYSCLAFAESKVLKEVAATIREELDGRPVPARNTRA